MKLLLDTHVFVWMLGGDRRLKAPARDRIQTADLVVVSVVSAWEIALKSGAGKLRVSGDYAQAAERSGVVTTALEFDDVAEFVRLPRHHPDPFDRMLVAQARVRGLVVLTHDRQIELYDVPVLVV